MTKRILVGFFLGLAAMTFHFGIGMSAGPPEEKPEKAPVPKISILEAIKTATDAVQGRVVEAELEDKDDSLFYEIEIVSNDGMVVEVQVDATSGQIMRQAKAEEVAYISVEEAIKRATEYLRWNVLEIELEEKDGEAVYEIKLVNILGDILELEIDALTGKVSEAEPEKQSETDQEKETD